MEITEVEKPKFTLEESFALPESFTLVTATTKSGKKSYTKEKYYSNFVTKYDKNYENFVKETITKLYYEFIIFSRTNDKSKK
jgi:fructose-1,6-bisphosphatase/inositol monophosphatase family enzyme